MKKLKFYIENFKSYILSFSWYGLRFQIKCIIFYIFEKIQNFYVGCVTNSTIDNILDIAIDGYSVSLLMLPKNLIQIAIFMVNFQI